MTKSFYGWIRVIALWSSVLWPGAATVASGDAVSIDRPTLVTCQVFVATNGNDANPGTITQPFASLDHARDFVRAHKAGATEPIVVCLRAGTYQLQHAFTLGPDDSGTAAAPIVYRSFPGEQAILSGGAQLHPNWSTYSGQIQVADVDLWFNQLFVNGVRATRARTPNGIEFLHLLPVADTTQQRSAFLSAGGLPAGVNRSDIEIVSIERFVAPRQRVAASNATTGTVEGTLYNVPSQKFYGYGSDYPAVNSKTGNDRYYIENSLAALDSPRMVPRRECAQTLLLAARSAGAH
jgi:hypothetical protein